MDLHGTDNKCPIIRTVDEKQLTLVSIQTQKEDCMLNLPIVRTFLFVDRTPYAMKIARTVQARPKTETLGENSGDVKAPELVGNVGVSIYEQGAVRITAEFDEPIKGFQLQYVSPDLVENDIQIEDLSTGRGTYRWKEEGKLPDEAAIFSKEAEENGRYDIYKFKRPDGTFYELRLSVVDNEVSIIFLNPGGMDDETYQGAVEMLIEHPSTHLKVKDGAGNLSGDVLHN